jgi:hypothetical protein
MTTGFCGHILIQIIFSMLDVHSYRKFTAVILHNILQHAWSPFQGVLPAVYRIKKLKHWPSPNKRLYSHITINFTHHIRTSSIFPDNVKINSEYFKIKSKNISGRRIN